MARPKKMPVMKGIPVEGMKMIARNSFDDMEEEDEQDGEHKIHCAMETLLKAEEIKRDPELMAQIEQAVGKKARSIQDLRDMLAKQDNYVEVSITAPKDEVFDDTGKVSVKSRKTSSEDE